MKWLPWKFIVRRMARSRGFLDPLAVLAKMRSFAQPSEVSEPVELLRAGMVLHARGLMNSRAIQQNLDWVWPWWVEKQFDPRDNAFVPRAFSLTHINLTYRNWTAFGIPDIEAFPLVDPSGGVIPITDGWTLEGWILTNSGELLAPSRLKEVDQQLLMEDNLVIKTRSEKDGSVLEAKALMEISDGRPFCRVSYSGKVSEPGWLVLSLRPYNPEGVSFIHEIELERGDRDKWIVEGFPLVRFDDKVEFHTVSDYHSGDVSIGLGKRGQADHVKCNVGMSTAASMYRLEPNVERTVSATLALHKKEKNLISATNWSSAGHGWNESMKGIASLSVPDEKIQFLYDAAIRSLILHSPDDVYPGPYTYRRFWFRDAAFLINAMLCANMIKRSLRCLKNFPERQTPFGFFHSQEGEWDSNGEALWIMNRYCELSGELPSPGWVSSAERGANWILRKRIPLQKDSPYAGLLPAGFSAEHLGTNDYYYWDDFWGVEGLRAAARMLESSGSLKKAEKFKREAVDYLGVIESYLSKGEERLGRPAMPASPDRRLDPGAVGSIVSGYPLQLWEPRDVRVLDTAEWLFQNAFVKGGFFQDMVHSGINAYLTLHIAQIMLRAGDSRAYMLVREIAEMATSTGQWPEAIHPHTGGGCMGDGQHVWAAAEWVMIIRNMFVFEENSKKALHIGKGIPAEWLDTKKRISFGPAPTPWGTVKVEVLGKENTVTVSWNGNWFDEEPPVKVCIEGCEQVLAEPGSNFMEVVKKKRRVTE